MNATDNSLSLHAIRRSVSRPVASTDQFVTELQSTEGVRLSANKAIWLIAVYRVRLSVKKQPRSSGKHHSLPASHSHWHETKPLWVYASSIPDARFVYTHPIALNYCDGRQSNQSSFGGKVATSAVHDGTEADDIRLSSRFIVHRWRVDCWVYWEPGALKMEEVDTARRKIRQAKDHFWKRGAGMHTG